MSLRARGYHSSLIFTTPWMVASLLCVVLQAVEANSSRLTPRGFTRRIKTLESVRDGLSVDSGCSLAAIRCCIGSSRSVLKEDCDKFVAVN